jgi:hypothetical protein
LTQSSEVLFDRELAAKEVFERIEYMEILQDVNQSDSVNLTWTYNGYPLCRTRFKIEISDEKSVAKSFETSETAVEVYDLTPCENYNITVFPIGSDKEEYGSTKPHKMNDALPSSIQDLNVVYNDRDESFDVTWKPPQFGEKCVKNYVVKALSSSENKEITTSFTNYRIVNLFACTIYTIVVYPQTFFEGTNGPSATKQAGVPSKGLQRS